MAIDPLHMPPPTLPPTQVRQTQPVPGPMMVDAVRQIDAEDARRPGPSEAALAAVQTAARVYEHLKSNGRELRFEDTDTGLRIEVYDGSGQLVRRIPPTEALALATRESTWLA